jgi:steroid 5-alpha reductase family enzyme
MVSGRDWTLTMGDLLLLSALVLLFIEVLKATRTGASSIVDHLLSTAVFVACLVEFLLVPQAASSTFFLLMVMTLFDVIAGFSVTIRGARRDFGVGADSNF